MSTNIELNNYNWNPMTLPPLPENLEQLDFGNYNWDFMNLLPLPEHLEELHIGHYKQPIQLLNEIRHFYYCLKLKNQFRKWLWVRVREPNIITMYHPDYLLENLKETYDLDDFLNKWT